MKLRSLLIALTTSLVLLSTYSCKKDVTPAPTPEPPVNPPTNPPVTPPAGEPGYIAQAEYYIKASGSEALFETWSYVYDSQKRLVNINDSNFNAFGKKLSSLQTFFYNGNDAVPYKKTNFRPGTDSITTFYYYDGNGQSIKDSSVIANYYSSGPTANGKGYSITTTEKVGNLIYKNTREFSRKTGTNGTFEDFVTDTRDTSTVDAGGNVTERITKQVHTNVTTSTSSVSHVKKITTFDDKTSLYSKINVRAGMNFLFDFAFWDISAGNNNPVSYSKVYFEPNYGEEKFNFSYTFGTDGLISRITFVSPYSPSRTEIFKFIYKAL